MNKMLLVITTAFVVSSGAVLAETSCDDISSYSFVKMAKAPVEVLAVGKIKKLRENVCSVVLDTTHGRVLFTYTTMTAVNGANLIRSISEDQLEYK